MINTHWSAQKEKEFIQSTLDTLNTKIKEGETTPEDVQMTKKRFPGGGIEFLTKYYNALKIRQLGFDGNGDLKSEVDFSEVESFLMLKVGEI